MRNLKRLAAILILLSANAHGQSANEVDPRIGTEGDGNTLIGPSMPFGMIKPGPDTDRNQTNSGWTSWGPINGFSQTHVSGTGGGPKYGNILLQPTVGAPRPGDFSSDRKNERASAGYYGVTLQRYPVDLELTTSNKAALYRFTYPQTRQANILFDTAHILTDYRVHYPHLGPLRDVAEEYTQRILDHVYKQGEAQYLTASQVTVVSPTEVSGSTSVTGGWNQQSNSYTVFFYAITDTPATSWGTWHGSTLHTGNRSEADSSGGKTGAWLTFATHQNQTVRLKIGISFVSADQARRNLLVGIPDFDFDRVHSQAVAAWNAALAPIEIAGATPAQSKLFYTSLYHTMLMPSDRTGDNPLWQSGEPTYDDFYAIWDTFRTSSPLLTLIAPQRQRDIIRSLIDIERHAGWMPDARSGNFNGRTQGGSDADIVLADAFVKQLPGIDWNAAWEAMQKDAEVSPPDQFKEGRGGLDDWRTLHYLSIQGIDRPASKTMEYAADDYALALVAKGLGKQSDYEKYLMRSGNWQNLWDASYAEAGFHGFIRSRNRDGSWKKNFNAMQHGSWGADDFYEGNSWTYSTFVPQDVRSLIQRSGSPAIFTKRLDAMFNVPGRWDVSNEPGFLAPYLYIWAGRQDKTAERVRQILAESYHPTPTGIPGNDDSGAMGSWYVFSALGIFPNAGQDVYLIGSPLLPLVTLHLADNKTFILEAPNTSPENKYVQSATLNGQTLNRAWLRHNEIVAGGRLTLQMGNKPAAWPTGPPPPSSSDH